MEYKQGVKVDAPPLFKPKNLSIGNKIFYKNYQGFSLLKIFDNTLDIKCNMY